MSQPVRFVFPSLPGRIRARLGQRAAAIFLTLLLEGLLALLLLTLAPSIVRHEESDIAVFGLNTAQNSEEMAPQPSEPKAQDSRPAKQPPEPEQASPQPVEPQPAPPLPPLIELSHEQMAATDISALRRAPPAAARQPTMTGPSDTGTPGDTQRVAGQGPHGEPLYAASWYREPYDDELRGYLSTAQGPGWGLIACRTVPDYRVEDCVAVDEYPHGSNITRAVLAAAWQFRVRPPRIGGQLKIGEWVRIRIDYELRRR